MSVVLVCNPGGSSKKYALYVSGTVVLEAAFESVGADFQVTSKDERQEEVVQSISKSEYTDSLKEFLAASRSYTERNKLSIDVIGIRVLAAGSKFQKHQIIDDVLISELRAKEPTAPLHIPVTLDEIQQCRAALPGVPIVATSDTAFFAALPAVAREFSLPKKDAQTYDLYRFGYHGLSVESIVARVHAVIGSDPERMIVCHIGSGVSVTGLKSGRAVYTSAGYSALTSLPMLSRGGDADAAMVLELLRLRHGKLADVNHYLHFDCGMKGIADATDVRIILDRKTHGDEAAAAALDMHTFAVQKAIAAATVATGGIDVLVVTGTIGQRSSDYRSLLLERLGHLGCGLDEDKNNLFLSREGVISPAKSLVKVVAMKTDEMRQIACAASQCVGVRDVK